MQFVVIVDGRIVGQVEWDGKTELPLPSGAALMTVFQAIDQGIPWRA